MDAGARLVRYMYLYEMVQQETSETKSNVKGGICEKYHIWKRLEKNGCGMT